MKTKSILTALLVSLALIQASAEEIVKVSTLADQPTTVTLSSKGTDVRFVLHDLFTQAKQSYVIKSVPRIDLYLSLENLDFEEALELILSISDLHYERQNGIYFISKGRRAVESASADKNNSESAPKTTGAPEKVTTEPTGKLPSSVLNKTIKGSYTKKELSTILEDFSKQTGVKIELDKKVPKYYLDFTINTTSLGWALRKLATELKLELVFTDRLTLKLQPKS